MTKEKCSSYSRICLDFENCPVVKCVFLVDHEQMPAVSDVVACIEKRHNLRSFCKNGNTKYISLWLNNYLIPTDESSYLLSHNDIISIRIQKTNSKDTGFVSECSESKATQVKKRERKRKRTESNDADEHADILKRAKEALLCKVDKFIALETPTDVRSQKLEISSQSSIKGRTDENVTITKDPESSNGSDVEEREADNTSNTVPAKGKRKRTRKRSRKKDGDVYRNVSHVFSAADTNITNDNTAKSKDMTIPAASKEVCFGSFPGKLQNPKHYRQGFRKAVVCKPEPSEHIRFGSDAEDAVTHAVEQYEYLNHNALEQKQMRSTRTEESMNCENEFSQNDSLQTLDAHLAGNGIPDRCFQESYKECLRTSDRDNTVGDGTQSVQLVNDGGSSLTRKVLSNGVTVFSRSRRGQLGRIVQDHSEMEQTEMEASTPVSSTPFRPQGTKEQEYKSTNLPKLHQQTPPTCSPVTSQQQQQNGVSSSPFKTDYSKCPPLVTLPKPGDKIVYKVLEMSVDCCPEVSDYKEALVLSVDKNQMIQMKIFSRQEVKYNKFHLEVEADNEVWTNIAENPETVTLHHSSLLEPKILV